MNEFESLIVSIGDHTFNAIKSHPGLHRVLVEGDSVTQDVHVEICLTDANWDLEVKLIARMTEVRELFVDDVALSYEFTTIDECKPAPEHATPTKNYDRVFA